MSSPNEATDSGREDLVEEVSADPKVAWASSGALSDLYEKHGSVLLAYLIGITRGDRHRAEDLLQETFMRAGRHPEARGATGEWSRPWLYTVARHIAIDNMRASMVRPVELEDGWIEERPMAEDRYEQLVDYDLVRSALASLPERFRTVLVEVYLRDRSVIEAAEILGVPPGTVKSRTFYALRALREEMIKRGFIKPA